MRNLIRICLSLVVLLSVAVAQPANKKADRDEAALKAVEAQWEAAALKGDVATLETIFADKFISTSPEGQVRNRAEMLAELKSGDLKILEAKVDEMKIFVHGDTGVVSGRWSGKFIEKGKTLESVERFTDTFVRQHGKWHCVSSHSSPIH